MRRHIKKVVKAPAKKEANIDYKYLQERLDNELSIMEDNDREIQAILEKLSTKELTNFQKETITRAFKSLSNRKVGK